MTRSFNHIRLEDWAERLDSYFQDIRTRPFSWGTLDCCLMAAGAIAAMTGHDPAAAFRGNYANGEEAGFALQDIGAGNVESTVIEILGQPLPTVMKAQRGDVVMFSTPDGDALGVVDLTGQKFAALTRENGLVSIPLRRAAAAWRV